MKINKTDKDKRDKMYFKKYTSPYLLCTAQEKHQACKYVPVLIALFETRYYTPYAINSYAKISACVDISNCK